MGYSDRLVTEEDKQELDRLYNQIIKLELTLDDGGFMEMNTKYNGKYRERIRLLQLRMNFMRYMGHKNQISLFVDLTEAIKIREFIDKVIFYLEKIEKIERKYIEGDYLESKRSYMKYV